MSSRVGVVCVDDHPLALRGLQARLEAEPGLAFAGGLSSAEGLVELVRTTGAGLVVMDIALPGRDPFEAVSELMTRLPDVRVVFLSGFIRDSYLDAAYAAGAWGYLSKEDDLDTIIASLKRVLEGHFAFGPRTLHRKSSTTRIEEAPEQTRLSLLTPTELHMLRLIGHGLSRAEIARQVHRSPKTVDTHFQNLMRKLGIHDRVQLALFAVREGLVEA